MRGGGSGPGMREGPRIVVCLEQSSGGILWSAWSGLRCVEWREGRRIVIRLEQSSGVDYGPPGAVVGEDYCEGRDLHWLTNPTWF